MRARAGAVAGLLAAGAALAAGELAAALVGERASPAVAVGEAVIDLSPRGVKEFAISTFGHADKLALAVGMGIVLALAAAALGALGARRPAVAYAGLLSFGVIGAVAAVTRPNAPPAALVPSAVAVCVGAGAFELLARSAPPSDRADTSRRRFLITGLGVAAMASAAAVAARVAGAATARALASRSLLRVPRASDVAPVPSGVDLRVPGLSSFYTANADFYRVDTALVVPKIRAEDWRLRIHGMVDHPMIMDLSDLLSRPLVERDITLACVSNKVGGDLVGNARWIGALLKPILEEAGVHPEADQVVSRSADGFTAGTPTAAIMDGRDAMLAIAMNGEPLPLEHGFPVRMIVPGLYGYVSATKWVVELELTTFHAFDAYWVQRGWARRAPIKTMSRIDTPRNGQQLSPGQIAIAGVAWAQHRGIAKVEVRIDDGPWQEAELGAADGLDTWRQWVYRWSAPPGVHTVAVRATDRTGYTQTREVRSPFPDGATGWHTIAVTVV